MTPATVVAVNVGRGKPMPGKSGMSSIDKRAAQGRVAVRHARTEAISKIKKTEHVSEDEKKHTEKDVQKLHDDHLRQVDEAVKAKEAEIMEI